MSAWLAAGAGALCAVLLLVVLAHLRTLRRDVGALRGELLRLSEGAATVDDLRAAVTAAVAPEAEPEPDPAPVTRVPQLLRTGPVIKAMALGSGTAHVARRLRGNGKEH